MKTYILDSNINTSKGLLPISEKITDSILNEENFKVIHIDGDFEVEIVVKTKIK